MTINFRSCFHKDVLQLQASANDSIDFLKLELYANKGIDFACTKLFYGKENLEQHSSKTLKELGIKNNATLTIGIKMKIGFIEDL